MYQRPLFTSDPLAEAAAYAARPERAPAPPPWLWLCQDPPLPFGVRVCCEPIMWPAAPGWLLTAWEPIGKWRFLHVREGYGRVDQRLPGRELHAAVTRLRGLQRSAEQDEQLPEDRARRVLLAAQTRKGILEMWRADALANREAALRFVAGAVPVAGELGRVVYGTVELDLEDYTPPVEDAAHWEVLRGFLVRPGERSEGGTP